MSRLSYPRWQNQTKKDDVLIFVGISGGCLIKRTFDKIAITTIDKGGKQQIIDKSQVATFL